MLQVFKTLPTVVDVHPLDDLPAVAIAYARDTIALGWEDRVRSRGRRRSDGGVEFGTALPRGTILRAGDCFVIDPARLIVSIVERPEPVLVVEPRSAAEASLFGYYIGNSHQPVMVADHAIVCPDVPGMDQVLEQCGIPFVRDTRPFTPVSMTGVGHGADGPRAGR